MDLTGVDQDTWAELASIGTKASWRKYLNGDGLNLMMEDWFQKEIKAKEARVLSQEKKREKAEAKAKADAEAEEPMDEDAAAEEREEKRQDEDLWEGYERTAEDDVAFGWRGTDDVEKQTDNIKRLWRDIRAKKADAVKKRRYANRSAIGKRNARKGGRKTAGIKAAREKEEGIRSFDRAVAEWWKTVVPSQEFAVTTVLLQLGEGLEAWYFPPPPGMAVSRFSAEERMADRNGGAGVRESADAMDTDGAGGQDVEHNAAADEFAERRDEREDEMMDTEGGVQGGEQGEDDDDIDREGSENFEGEREGSGAEESGAEVGEGGKGKKRKTRKKFKRMQRRAGLGQKGEGGHAQAETAAGAEGETV